MFHSGIIDMYPRRCYIEAKSCCRKADVFMCLRGEIRSEWLEAMHKIAFPILSAAADNRLHSVLPLSKAEKRRGVAYLEAAGRTLIGIAPWLELSLPRRASKEERTLQEQYRLLARKTLINICDPSAADYCVWNKTGVFLSPDQPMVDAAFLASALLKAPTQLFELLPEQARSNLLSAFGQTRLMRPVRNNWLLFAAMIEAMRYRFTGIGDGMRIEYALSKHYEWYKGDGAYGDGELFHWDYYNSFVIQPMLEEISRVAQPLIGESRYREQFVKSLARYCEVLERMIAPDGTYPCMGRSIAYRTGALHALAHAALTGQLPSTLPPGQVRRALSLALRRMLASPELFDTAGFLQKGLSGCQPKLAESYINTGSLYLCSTIFLPLGLSPTSPFWTEAEQPITWEKAWSGAPLMRDHAL